jgi:hypothetical protein
MLLLLITMLALSASASNRMLSTELEVNAPIEKVWDAWTTPDGIETFYAPDCFVVAGDVVCTTESCLVAAPIACPNYGLKRGNESGNGTNTRLL